MKKFTFIIAPIALAILSGCSATKQIVNTEVVRASATIEQQQAVLRNSVMEAEKQRIANQEVQRPFLAGNSQPIARDVRMPEILRKSVPVTAMFSNTPVDLLTALQQVSQASGMSLTATPDALLPSSAFAVKTAGAASPVSAPTRVSVRANNTPIWQVLDDLARQSSSSWRPTAAGAEFYRVETRVFELSAIPQTANTSASLGRSGGSTLFESQSKSSFEMKDQNLMNGIQKTVEAMLSTGGKMTMSTETQTLVVTDTIESLDRVARYVKDQNKAAGRRVRLVVEAIEVIAKDGSDIGIDWSLVYAAANRGLSISSPASLVSSQAGGFGSSITSGDMAGSSMAIKALNEVGQVVSRRSFPMMTTSGRPITQALRTTFNYVDSVQAVSSPASSSTTQATTAPTVSQKDETVGTFLTLVPTAKSDGTIFLSVSFDTTSADPLRPFTVGAGSGAVTVQQKTINGTGTIQEVPIRSGRTEVIGGMEILSAQTTSRRLANGVPMLLGGSDSDSLSRRVLVLLVTAVSEEGI